MAQIIVIEDEIDVLENIIDILTLAGYEAEGASNPMMGLNLIRQQHPDLILCDIMMPGFDGYTLLQEVRKDATTTSTPFIFITARADKEAMRQGMELGADDYLTKPFTSEQLIKAIEARLQRHQMITHEMGKATEINQLMARTFIDEIRKPLQGVNLAMKLASQQIGSLTFEQIEDLLGTIAAGNNRLNRIIQQMEYSTRLQSGALTPEAIQQRGRAITVADILDAAVNLAYSFIGTDYYRFVQNTAHHPHVTIMSHTALIKHAIAELIANALLYTPENSKVEVAQWATDDGMTLISIVDYGMGMSQEQRDLVLSGQYQIPRDPEGKQGMGVGLILARDIIEVHSGTMDFTSVAGKGTEVLVRLPIYQG